MTLQPENDIRFSAHGTDFDDLIEAEEMRGNTAINGIGKGPIVFAIGFDDRGRMNASGCAKRVVANHGIIGRNRRAGRFGHFLAIFLETR